MSSLVPLLVPPKGTFMYPTNVLSGESLEEPVAKQHSYLGQALGTFTHGSELAVVEMRNPRSLLRSNRESFSILGGVHGHLIANCFAVIQVDGRDSGPLRHHIAA